MYDPGLIVEEVIKLLRETPARRIAEVAACLSVSRQTLARACQQAGRGTPRALQEVILHERMKDLMTAVPPKSIKEISDGLGFATPRSFARWVKRNDGLVPRALRDALCRRLEVEESRAHGEYTPASAPHDTLPGTPLAGGATSSPCAPITAPGAARAVTYDGAARSGRRLAWLTSRGPTCPWRAAAGAC